MLWVEVWVWLGEVVGLLSGYCVLLLFSCYICGGERTREEEGERLDKMKDGQGREDIKY